MTRAGRLIRPYATALAFLASARTPTARAFHSDPTARTGLFTSSCQNAAQFSTWPACLAVTTGAQSQLENALNPAFQESVRNLWFEHVKQDEDLIVPSMEIAKRWFQRDNDFDRVCMSAFGRQLEVIKSANASGAEILAAARPASPLDWLSLILLLDQIPRNSFRGSEARTAFVTFDPKALEIALLAIEAGIPENLQIRYRLAYRFWFYLPLQHSESLKIQEMAMREHEKMFNDVRMLINTPTKGSAADIGDIDTLKCQAVLSRNKEGFDSWEGAMMDIVKAHKDIIDEFGRYPHRNQALGRQSTKDETEYIETGGRTFGS